jgi:hypothetical protein
VKALRLTRIVVNNRIDFHKADQLWIDGVKHCGEVRLITFAKRDAGAATTGASGIAAIAGAAAGVETDRFEIETISDFLFDGGDKRGVETEMRESALHAGQRP